MWCSLHLGERDLHLTGELAKEGLLGAKRYPVNFTQEIHVVNASIYLNYQSHGLAATLSYYAARDRANTTESFWDLAFQRVTSRAAIASRKLIPCQK